MKTYLECIPCFFKQALEAVKICTDDPRLRKEVIDEVARMIPELSLESSPPEMGKAIHDIVKKKMKVADPYKERKRKSNETALAICDRLKEKVKKSPDSLLTAVELAVAGNIIDYGVKNTLNVDRELEKILEQETEAIKNENTRFFNFSSFKEKLASSEKILYLGDNAGEIVFDRILIEEINALGGKEVIYAVKEAPIINDALEKDAIDCGVDKVAKVISSGSDAPGTVLSLCSDEFLDIFKRADMVISKGQGNFEALSGHDRPVFFLFMAKCEVVVKDVGCGLGDILLLYNGTKRK